MSPEPMSNYKTRLLLAVASMSICCAPLSGFTVLYVFNHQILNRIIPNTEPLAGLVYIACYALISLPPTLLGCIPIITLSKLKRSYTKIEVVILGLAGVGAVGGLLAMAIVGCYIFMLALSAH